MAKVECLPFDALDDRMQSEMTALRDAQSAYDNPFFDLDFARILARIRSDVRVLVATEDQTLVGFWVVHLRPGKWVRPIGAPFSDWHGPILQEGVSGLSPEVFLRLAGLRGMTATGLQGPTLASQFGGDISGCGIVETPEGGEVYRTKMKGLHPKHFKNIRRAERLTARDFENSHVEIDDPSKEAYDWLMNLKQSQFERTGRHNVLQADWAQSMMETLRTERFPRLRGRLSTLRLDGKLAAAEFDILSDKVVHGWITVYDQAYSSYSPGHILMLSVICDMANTGHETCDIGADDHSYKTYYQSYQQPSERAVIYAGNGIRPLASTWRLLETNTPARLGRMMTRIRRRSDQIVATELSFGGRLKGFSDALLPKKQRNK